MTLLTEEEAKERWCRYTYRPARILAGADGEVEDDPIDVPTTCCIGSACQAWRWEDAREYVEREKQAGHALEQRGYCGAFGKP